MLLNLTLSLVVLALVTVLALATIIVRKRHSDLRRQQQVEHELRGAEHIKKVALATHSYTGRSDVPLALLQLARQQLEAAHKLAPQHQPLAAALRDWESLSAALRQGTIVTEPATAPLDSETVLNHARMQLLEALRLLARVDKQGWIAPADLQAMHDSLKQAQRSIELRLDLRQAAQTGAPAEPGRLETEEHPIHMPSR